MLRSKNKIENEGKGKGREGTLSTWKEIIKMNLIAVRVRHITHQH